MMPRHTPRTCWRLRTIGVGRSAAVTVTVTVATSAADSAFTDTGLSHPHGAAYRGSWRRSITSTRNPAKRARLR